MGRGPGLTSPTPVWLFGTKRGLWAGPQSSLQGGEVQLGLMSTQLELPLLTMHSQHRANRTSQESSQRGATCRKAKRGGCVCVCVDPGGPGAPAHPRTEEES